MLTFCAWDSSPPSCIHANDYLKKPSATWGDCCDDPLEAVYAVTFLGENFVSVVIVVLEHPLFLISLAVDVILVRTCVFGGCVRARIVEGNRYRQQGYRRGCISELFFPYKNLELEPGGYGAGGRGCRCRPLVRSHGWSHPRGTGKPRPGSDIRLGTSFARGVV
jgi:hypothetical protein